MPWCNVCSTISRKTCRHASSVSGGLFLYEAGDIDTVRRLVHEDPFNTEGVWRTVDIRFFPNRADEH
ncbi:YciI family protein [Burkholderia sp. BCC1998]|uniref:YciI family protein n=1 Tax=Burkholderia sp. BCC1998 TaxID=2817447 RepID=UPI0039F14E0B